MKKTTAPKKTKKPAAAPPANANTTTPAGTVGAKKGAQGKLAGTGRLDADEEVEAQSEKVRKITEQWQALGKSMVDERSVLTELLKKKRQGKPRFAAHERVTAPEHHACDTLLVTKPNVTAAKYGWPPIMRLAIACLYTARSRWTLQRAVAKGDLVVAGRQGRSVTFRKEDLDRWLLGTPYVYEDEDGEMREAFVPKSEKEPQAKVRKLKKIQPDAD